MTEILTESFCERCGTRYTFEPVQPKRGALGKIGTLGRGFRHFVTDPGSSLDEAFAVAKSEQEQRSTNHALEAFHRTFNFCLSCRQYTCADCWNTVEGRCLSCAPTAESLEPPATRMDTPVVLAPIEFAPPAAPIPLDAEADLRNAGPWIGGPPEHGHAAEAAIEHEEPVALEPVATIDSAEELDARIAAAHGADIGEPPAAEAAIEAVAEVPVESADEPAEAVELAVGEVAETGSTAAIEAVAPQLDPWGRPVEPVADAAPPPFDTIAHASQPAVRDAERAEAVAPAPEAVAEPIESAVEPIESNAEPTDESVPAEFGAVPVGVAAEAAEVAAETPAPVAEALERVTEVTTPSEPILESDALASDDLAEPPSADGDLVFEPGLNLDEQIAAYERSMAAEAEPPATTPEAEPEAAAAAFEAEPDAPEAEIVAAPELEHVAAEAEAEAQPIAEPDAIAFEVEPEPLVAEVEPEPLAAEVEPEPVAAAAEPVVAEVEPEPVAAAAEPVAAEVEPEPAAAEVEPVAVAPEPSPAEELPIAASTARPLSPIEPIPTAIGTPLPASVVDGPLAWPQPDIAAAAFEQQWPDIPVPRRSAPAAPAPQPAPLPQQAIPVPAPPTAAMRRTTGAHLPAVTAPPPILVTHACPSCGLSLSASARFCRRCGTPQQVDAAR